MEVYSFVTYYLTINFLNEVTYCEIQSQFYFDIILSISYIQEIL